MWMEGTRSRWIDIVARSGKVLPRIWPRVLVVVALSIVVTVLYEKTKTFHISITPTPFSLIGWPLAIFLGFRNGATYDRFWEGRKLWGALVNQTRSFTRQVLTFVDADASVHKDLVYRTIAFTHALRHHMRDHVPYAELEPFLPPQDIEALRGQPNVPVLILQNLGLRLTEARKKGQLDPLHATMLEQSLMVFTDVQGACERIKTTPVPFSYTVLMHRVVGAYCTLLPFGLAESIHWLTPLVVMFISYAFFGLDSIGDELEQPFGLDRNDLPLSAISRNIERVLRMQLGETNLPPALTPQNHILN